MMDPSQTVLSWRKFVDNVKFPKDSFGVIDLVCGWKQSVCHHGLGPYPGVSDPCD